MDITQIIGFIAGIFTATSLLPQVVKTIKEHKAAEVSIAMLLVLLIGVALWVVYGWLKKDIPIIVTNSFSLLLNLLMIYLRIRYGRR